VRATISAAASSAASADTSKKGIARDDAKEMGDLIEAGQATLLVIGESRLEEQLDKVLTRAEKTIEKEIDVDRKEFKRELDAAQKEYAAS
jgi:uncharacterized membrane protein